MPRHRGASARGCPDGDPDPCFAATTVGAPAAALADTYVRADGAVFDSRVGAVCGALTTLNVRR